MLRIQPNFPKLSKRTKSKIGKMSKKTKGNQKNRKKEKIKNKHPLIQIKTKCNQKEMMMNMEKKMITTTKNRQTQKMTMKAQIVRTWIVMTRTQ